MKGWACVREFIRLGMCLSLLVGCSGGGSNSGTGASSGSVVTPTIAVAGAVNPAEIGGTGLTVVSAYADAMPVGPNQGFSSTVVQGAPQVLFVFDSSGAVRGLALSMGGAVLQVDATSTALGLLWLTPGVLALDLTEAQARVSQLRALASFANLVTYLQANLPLQPLDTLKNSVDLPNLLGAVLQDWLASLPPPLASSSSTGQSLWARLSAAISEVLPPLTDVFTPTAIAAPSTSTTKTLEAGLVRVIVPDPLPDSTAIPATIENHGARYIRIYKVPYDLANNIVLGEITLVPGTENLNGLVLPDFGSFLSGNASTPTTFSDSLAMPSTISKVQYWVVGMGWQGEPNGDLPLETGHGPHGVSNVVDQSTGGQTIAAYLLPETLKALMPGVGGQGAQIILNLTSQIVVAFAKGQYPLAFNDVYTVCCDTAASINARGAALLNLTKTFTQALIAQGLSTGDLATNLKSLLRVLSGVDQIFALYDMSIIAKHFVTLPHVALIEIQKTNPWVGTWVGSVTSTCGYYSGPLTYTITSGGGTTLNISYDAAGGGSFTATYSGNSATSTNGAILMTLNGNLLSLTQDIACQTATFTRQ